MTCIRIVSRNSYLYSWEMTSHFWTNQLFTTITNSTMWFRSCAYPVQFDQQTFTTVFQQYCCFSHKSYNENQKDRWKTLLWSKHSGENPVDRINTLTVPITSYELLSVQLIIFNNTKGLFYAIFCTCTNLFFCRSRHDQRFVAHQMHAFRKKRSKSSLFLFLLRRK